MVHGTNEIFIESLRFTEVMNSHVNQFKPGRVDVLRGLVGSRQFGFIVVRLELVGQAFGVVVLGISAFHGYGSFEVLIRQVEVLLC